MIFSSIPFLYYFLPVVVLLYFAVCRRGRATYASNLVLLAASLLFYGYGEPRYLIMIGIAILSAWALALLIPRQNMIGKLSFWVSVAISLGLLGWFKYVDFFIESFAAVTGMEVETLGVTLPIGISFYTFQILSYTIDVHRGKIAPQKNLFNFAMYVSLFPQLIAGPIVVYSQVEAQIEPSARQVSADAVYEGIRRFMIGLSKKVLLANQLGMVVDQFTSLSQDQRSVVFYWIYAIAFSLQIYFDFSGYSDMAIGLGRMFGFDFPENFNYPYIAKSVTEFWRRWHMTLSGWFREYVYIPLGGSRVSAARMVVNLFIVWGLTGLWHGAAWTFVVWGLYHGILLMFEKFALSKILPKMPAFLSHFYVLLTVIISMVIFNAANMTEAIQYIGAMFGIYADGGLQLINPLTLYYLRSYGLLLILSALGATPVVKRFAKWLNSDVIEPVVLITLLLVVTAYLVDGSFNPFLYFRF